MGNRILLVEDDDDLRSILAKRLEVSGHVVRQAANGEEAVRAAPLFKPELVILDVNMPLKDGYQTCQELRDMRDFADTPIIFLTARGEDWDLLTGYSKGCDKYLVKPVDFDDLKREIQDSLS